MGRLALITLFLCLLTQVLLTPVAAQSLLRYGAAASGSPSVMARLPQVVVTGTRTEKTRLESPVRTEVVSREEIEKTHARDLKEALENVSGLQLKPVHGKTGFEAWLQGFDADRVLVLIDGEPIAPSTGSAVDLSQIATADIERIEIVKGATSALYGSNAMGGVINIITRRPRRALAYELTLDGGSYGGKNLSGNALTPSVRHLSGNVTLRRPEGYVQLNGSLRGQDGYSLNPESFRAEGGIGTKGNIDLRLGWTPVENTEIYFAPRYYREAISNNLTSLAPGMGEIEIRKSEDAQRFHASLGFARGLRNGGRVRGWLLRDNWRSITRQDALASPGVEQERTAEIKLHRAELQWDMPWGESQALTWGLLLSKAALEQYQDRIGRPRIMEVAGKQQRSLEAYLQNDIFIGEHWEVVPGLRVQHDSGFGFYSAPKINVLFSPQWSGGVIANIRLSAGRGYRVPNLKERFFVFDHSQLGYRVLGSESLRPERSDNYQLGAELTRPGHFRAEFVLFHNRINNLIGTRLNPVKSDQAGLSIFDYQNLARAMTQGMELSGDAHWRSWRVQGGYTLLDSRDLDIGKTLKNRPRHQITLGVDWKSGRGVLFSWRAVYQSKEYFDADNQMISPSWLTLDAKISHELSRGFYAFGGIDNFFDEHRNPESSHDNRPQAGRFIYFGVRVTD